MNVIQKKDRVVCVCVCGTHSSINAFCCARRDFLAYVFAWVIQRARWPPRILSKHPCGVIIYIFFFCL